MKRPSTIDPSSPKGTPLPRNPWSRFFLSLKAGLATALALCIDHLSGNPDHVSSTFIAVVCVSPVVLIGLKRARDQVMGSAIGGIAGTLMALAGLPLELGIPLAVATGVLICFFFGFGEGYLLASFAALFVQAVPFGYPISTLGIRGLAVFTGAASGLLINVVMSAFVYRSIFTRRLRFAEATVIGLIHRAAQEGTGVARQGVPYLMNLEQELAMARRELEWRSEPIDWVDRLEHRLDQLQRLLHLVSDLDDLMRHHGISETDVTCRLSACLNKEREPTSLPEAFNPTLDRLTALLHELESEPNFQGLITGS